MDKIWIYSIVAVEKWVHTVLTAAFPLCLEMLLKDTAIPLHLVSCKQAGLITSGILLPPFAGIYICLALQAAFLP